MGLKLFGNSSCRHSENYESYSQQDANPDPKKFSITKTYNNGGKFTAAVVNYPNCTNYEGNKILVLECSEKELLSTKELDPHFCKDNHIKPFARFEPTVEGWHIACKLVNSLH